MQSSLAEEKGQSAAGLLHTSMFQWVLVPGTQLSFVLEVFNHQTTFSIKEMHLYGMMKLFVFIQYSLVCKID